MWNFNRFYSTDSEAQSVIGTYLYPYCIFGEPGTQLQANDPEFSTAIIGHADVGSDRVYISRNGGLFIKPPEFLAPFGTLSDNPEKDFRKRLEYQQQAVRAFNQLICELCLHGVISQPATSAHVSRGVLIDNHAIVISGGGGRETYLQRTIEPSLNMLTKSWITCAERQMSDLTASLQLQAATKLSAISPTLTTFVASAYSLYSQAQFAEALLDSWIVVEQLLNQLWSSYTMGIADNQRQTRLRDTRTYSAAVRLELLLTAGAIPAAIYESASEARKHRNDLAHGAKVSEEAASGGMKALKHFVEYIAGFEVAFPIANTGVQW